MLNRLRKLDKPIRVGIVGVGMMGGGLFYQTEITPGITCAALADRNIDKSVQWAEQQGRAYRIVETLPQAEDAIRNGLLAISADGNLLAQIGNLDVVLESSSSILEGGQFAETALKNGKHLVLMNAEIDLLFGPYLMQLARQNGLVSTTCDGDQPGVLKRLIDEIQLWGFDFVMAGNIKGYLDRYSNPTAIIPEADKRSLTYKMAASFTDGTKMAIENAIVANTCGALAATPGMFGPRAKTVHEALDLFDLPALWQDRTPKVDYLLGAEPGGGVFVIAHCEHPYQQKLLNYYKVGKGPFYVIYRPHHICHIEAMRCIAEAVLDKQPLMQPEYGFLTNVYSYAKTDLKAGDTLDGIGGYTCYGLLENRADNEATPGLPIGLANQVTLMRDVKKDSKILMEDITYDPHRSDFVLFKKSMEITK